MYSLDKDLVGDEKGEQIHYNHLILYKNPVFRFHSIMGEAYDIWKYSYQAIQSLDSELDFEKTK